MTQHLHPTVVEGCYRCDLGADELPYPETQAIHDAVKYQAAIFATYAGITAEEAESNLRQFIAFFNREETDD